MAVNELLQSSVWRMWNRSTGRRAGFSRSVRAETCRSTQSHCSDETHGSQTVSAGWFCASGSEVAPGSVLHAQTANSSRGLGQIFIVDIH